MLAAASTAPEASAMAPAPWPLSPGRVRRHGRTPAASAMATATTVPEVRETATGHSTPDCPAFFRQRKNRPNPAPAVAPYARPRRRLAGPREPAPFVPILSWRPATGPADGMLTRTMAARQIRPPAAIGAVTCSPPATATPTGSTAETSAATGATVLIGAAAKPA